MKALSIDPDFAMCVALGEKTIEFRTWATKHRGDLLVCSTKRPSDVGSPRGFALGVVDLVDVRPFRRKDRDAAMMDCAPKGFAWVLERPRLVKPFAVRGMPGLFDVSHDIEFDDGDEHLAEWFVPVCKPGSEAARIIESACGLCG